MRVLIAPVGEQPTPNLIPLFAMLSNERPQCVQFLVSDNKRIGDVVKHLGDAITKDTSLTGVKVAEARSMDAWNLDKARNDCIAVIESCLRKGHEVTVNITGGTKIMSLAAYQAAVHAGVPMLYVNSELSELIHFDEQGRRTPAVPFKIHIPIETQLRAAGREFSPTATPLLPQNIPSDRADFAKHLAVRYPTVYDNLIRKIIEKSGGAGIPVSLTPTPKSLTTARLGQQIGLWRWNQQKGTFTVTDKNSYGFLDGGWVEIYALTSLAGDRYRRFDEVLGTVEIKNFSGELDVVFSRNGRLGIIECKTIGPKDEGGIAFAVAKVRLHEIILGGSYAMTFFVQAATVSKPHRDIYAQYGLPVAIAGAQLKQLADTIIQTMNT